jgi:hypothetical protein
LLGKKSNSLREQSPNRAMPKLEMDIPSWFC